MKYFFFKTILICFSFFFLIIFFEIFLYLENYSPKYKTYKYNLLNNEIQLNVDLDKLFLEKKISIALGDSFTQGKVCAGKNKDFPSQLNKIQNLNFYNLGMPDGSPIRYIKILDELNLNNVENIILTLYYNDINIDKKGCNFYKYYKNKIYFYPKKCDEILNSKTDSSNNTFLKRVNKFLESKSYLWLLVREASVNLPFINQFYNRYDWKNFYQDQFSDENKALLSDLQFIKDLAKKNKINLFLLYYPDINYLENSDPRVQHWQTFIKIAANKGVYINDPWEFFLKNKTKKNMSWSLIDKHPNCDAHFIMADYIRKEILKKN